MHSCQRRLAEQQKSQGVHPCGAAAGRHAYCVGVSEAAQEVNLFEDGLHGGYAALLGPKTYQHDLATRCHSIQSSLQQTSLGAVEQQVVMTLLNSPHDALSTALSLLQYNNKICYVTIETGLRRQAAPIGLRHCVLR